MTHTTKDKLGRDIILLQLSCGRRECVEGKAGGNWYAAAGYVLCLKMYVNGVRQNGIPLQLNGIQLD